MSRAAEWREKSRNVGAVDLELPSGMVIKARRPDPVQLASWGKLPVGLLMAARGGAVTPDKISDEEAIEMANFSRDLLIWCCVDPQVSLEPQGENEIHPRDIIREDWTFILGWALRGGEVRALEGFRRQRADAGDSGSGEDVRAAAGSADGDSGPGGSAGVRPGGGGAAEAIDRG